MTFMDDMDDIDTDPYRPNDIDARYDRIEEVGMTQDILETDPVTVAVTEEETGETYVVVPDRTLCTCDEPGPDLTCSHVAYIVTQAGDIGDIETDVADEVIENLSGHRDSIRAEIGRLSDRKGEFELDHEAVTQLLISFRGEGPDPKDRYNIPDPDDV